MKKTPLMSALLVLLSMVSNSDAKNSIRVQVTNPSASTRACETVSLSWRLLSSKLPSLTLGNAVVLEAKTGAELVTQEVGGEFLFQSSFKPNETKSFIIKSGPPRATKPQSLVDGRFVEPRQDYAWENDRIAFRMYGPALAKEVSNGIDVWTKRVRSLVVEKWYAGDQDTGSAKISYHADHGEGADFFSVGKTLGAGGCGIWYNDKVYQPGVFSSYRTIANGPIRLVFELTYDSLVVEGYRLKAVKRITLDAGQNLNRVEVTYTGKEPSSEIIVAAGLVKRNGAKLSKNENERWICLWGLTNADTVNGSLGTGVVIASPSFQNILEDKDQHLITGKARIGKPFVYYAGAGWTRSGDFESEEAWREYLSAFSKSLQAPLRVSMK